MTKTVRRSKRAAGKAGIIKAIKKMGTVKSAIEKIDSKLKLRRYKIRDYKPNVSFSFERGHFLIKMAESGVELEECLKLRFEVFHREYMQKKRKIGIDLDKLDFICDHLIIFDKRTGRAVGTYRLNCSLFTDYFYSADEFNIDEVLELPGIKLEVGRACIDKDFRTGAVISLLWRGIFEYIRLTNVKLVFGCTSIKTVEPLQIGLLTKHITETVPIEEGAHVPVTKKYKVKNLRKVLEYIEHNAYEYKKDEISKMIPTLFISYLNLGAKVCPEPALDRAFGCIDFLTVLKIDEMNPTIKGKYKI